MDAASAQADGEVEGSDVATESIGRGTLLAGRYRLEDLLAESAGARFWRATDTVLARSVAIHAVASDDERSGRLLEAARVSATVSDPHLLRVLDCDTHDGITWVVNEWGDGVSLDLMLQQGPLPAARAAWLVREVAEAVAAGHAQGTPHGRLNPEAVLVTQAGAVKLIGYVVDASLQPPHPPDPVFGELTEREADVINLAGILYAALTGKWPGVAPSSVPRAPVEGRRPLRPRQVRAGVPRTLDAICERVLHKEGSQHALPIETAHEVAAALADYVGDPALSAPVDPSGMHLEPDTTPTPSPSAGSASDDLDLEATQLTPQPWQPPRPVVEDDEATQIYREPLESPDDLTPLAAPGPVEAPPPPPFEDTPERPLFASNERRVPSGVGTGGLGGGGAAGGPEPTSMLNGSVVAGVGSAGGPENPGFWPFVEEPEEPHVVHTGREGRGWLRTAVAVGVLLVLVVVAAVVFSRGTKDTPTSDGGGKGSSSPSASAHAGGALKIAAVHDFDPYGSPPEENPQTVANAVDGDPATTWTTMTYRRDPALGLLKPGVGLMVDLGKDQSPTSLTVRLVGAPTTLDVYAASSGVTSQPTSLDQLDKVGSTTATGEKATVQLQPAPKTRFLLVWLTRLPPAPGGYRGEVAEISVRS